MPGGRPSTYKPEYCEKIIEWFDKEPFSSTVIQTSKGEKIVHEPIRLPTIENFARSLGTGTSTIHDWKNKFPEFSDALTRAKELQKDILVQNGLFGHYEKTFAKFVAVNVTDMKDKVEQDITSGGEAIQMPTIKMGGKPQEIKMGNNNDEKKSNKSEHIQKPKHDRKGDSKIRVPELPMPK